MNLGPNPTDVNPAPTTEEATNIRTAINAGAPGDVEFATNKASIADGDKFGMLDSAAADAPKHALWSLIKSTFVGMFIRHDTAQSLTDGQKAQAVDNLALVITRSAALGPPTVPASIVVPTSGITVDGVNPYSFERLFYDGMENARPTYRFGGSAVKYGVNSSAGLDPVWQLMSNEVDETNAWISESTDFLPVGLTYLEQGTVTGEPSVKASVEYLPTDGFPSPAFIGQRCIVGTTSPLEYTSLDGSTWTLTGPAGVIESTPGQYLRATHDGASVVYSSYTPED